MSSSLKVSFETLGCRYNRFETSEMAYELEQAGYEEAVNGELSDLVVINTCTVTDKTDTRCRAAIRKAKKEHPNATIVVAGCYSETNREEVASIDGVALTLGTDSKFNIVSALKAMEDKSELPDTVTSERLPVRPIKNLTGRTNGYINIQGGCDETCSFCIVRFARGGNRSADPTEIIEQVKRLSGAGIREVVLSGINLGAYGKGKGSSLAQLVRGIVDKTDMERIRFSSINPNTITDELIETIATSDRICGHLHIPLQSGSDKILKMMRRPYTSNFYEELLKKLVDQIPVIGLAADVMVGFPGETEDDFNDTYQLIERSGLMALHVFAFSPREGTDAFAMPGFVQKDTGKERSARLRELGERKGAAFRSKFIGKRLKVLVENKRDNLGRAKGFSMNYIPVVLDGSDDLLGNIVSVKAEREDGDRLFAVAL